MFGHYLEADSNNIVHANTAKLNLLSFQFVSQARDNLN